MRIFIIVVVIALVMYYIRDKRMQKEYKGIIILDLNSLTEVCNRFNELLQKEELPLVEVYKILTNSSEIMEEEFIVLQVGTWQMEFSNLKELRAEIVQIGETLISETELFIELGSTFNNIEEFYSSLTEVRRARIRYKET